MKKKKTMSPELIDSMIEDRKVRKAIIKNSHWHFFHFYFAHYVKYATANFQSEIFDLTEKEEAGNLFIVAFRGSGKSTIITTSYPLWSILGRHQKKFVLILCQTQNQAKQHMMNIRQELENNSLLKNDLGPFKEDSGEWGSLSIVFSNLNARITAASSEQSIRGLRHNQNRPDLIIGDDVEDINSTKTKEGRGKTYQWITGEIIPAGDKNTRLVIVGNLLHEDSLLMRIKEDIEKKRIDGVFKSYPLIEDKKILWTGKYPTARSIMAEKRKTANESAWQREYMLRIVPSEEQAIHREWFHYYDKLPRARKDKDGYVENVEIRIGVDLAISKKDTADYTAMVPAQIVGEESNARIYILPEIINKRVSFPETVQLCKALCNSYSEKSDHEPMLVIEDVSYQKSLPQQLENDGIRNIATTSPGRQDKRSRIILTGNLIKNGKILFPRHGCEQLIQQLVHFGVEKHDDLADAFSILILSVIEKPPKAMRIRLL